MPGANDTHAVPAAVWLRLRPSWASRWWWRSMVSGSLAKLLCWCSWIATADLSRLLPCGREYTAGKSISASATAHHSMLGCARAAAAAAAGKEADEGSISSVRDPWFKMVHGLLDSSLASGGPLRGSLFWQVSEWGATEPSKLWEMEMNRQAPRDGRSGSGHAAVLQPASAPACRS